MISYCTNVHPAQDLAGVLDQLDRFAVPVRATAGGGAGLATLGLGLWLAADVAAGLAADPAATARLRAELTARGLAVTTLNAFPYGGFHDEVVKHAVYRPDWTDPRRLAYTRDTTTVLAGLLPDDATGSVSTLPLGWRTPWGPEQDAAAVAALDALSTHLRGLDRPVRLAVEPEPGCVLDTVADAVGRLAGRVDPRHVGLCVDTCHLAVSFADPGATLAGIAAAGLDVVKVQASVAVHAARPADARDALAGWVEPRYLHQVRELGPDGSIGAADDLDAALRDLPGLGPWRVHFHVPLHWRGSGPLAPTTDVLAAVLAEVDPHVTVEVETYTWHVLPHPPATDAALVAGIAAELDVALALRPDLAEGPSAGCADRYADRDAVLGAGGAPVAAAVAGSRTEVAG